MSINSIRSATTALACTPSRPLFSAAVLLAIGLAAGGPAAVRASDLTGKEVVATTCAACHEQGQKGAPRIGDHAAWAKRSAQGLESLTQHALQGIRKMPPHGANFSLSDIEIQRAITYMVNQSGGHWTEPISKSELPPLRTGVEIVAARCHDCHETGVGGAPKIGDQAAWAPRLSHGIDALVRSAINGHGGMPARGGMANVTDAELRSAIQFMYQKKDAATH